MAEVATVTIQSSQVSADLTDFVVYVNLADLPSSFWDVVADGGGDIRCYKSDGTTELPREVVSCVQASDTGELHIKYSGTLSSSVDTEIQIHADGSSSDYAVTATYGRNNVWTGYDVVYHFHDASTTDSTGNGNTLSTSGTPNSQTGTTKIGINSTNFDQTSTAEHFYCDNVTVSNDRTVCALVYPDAWPNNDDRFIYTLEHPTTINPREVFGHYFRTNNDEEWDTFTGVTWTATLNSTNTSGVWNLYHLASTTANGVAYYKNGSTVETSTANRTSMTSIDLGIMTTYSSGRVAGTNLDGKMDEFRIMSSKMSSDWSAAEWTNFNTPTVFYTTAAVGGGGGGPTFKPRIYFY